MPAYKKSSYLTRDAADPALWRQTYTGERIKPGPALQGVIEEILAPALDGVSEGRAALLELVALELAERGFLVPADLVREEAHLDCLRPLKYTERLFDLPRMDIDALPGTGAAIVFGVPCDLGADHAGAANGPGLVRKASQRLGWRGNAMHDTFNVSDGANPFSAVRAGDVGDIRLSQRDLPAWLATVEDIVARIAVGDVPVMLGGDHVFTLAAVASIFKARGGQPFTLVQFDQHLDIQFQGEFSEDKPRQLRPPTHHNFMSHVHALSPEIRIVQIGIDHYQCAGRGNREQTVRYLRAMGAQVSNLDARLGDGHAIAALIGQDQDVYLTLDVDVFPREFMSSTGYPADLGVPLETLMPLLFHAVSRNRIIGMDIMEFGVTEPNRDQATNAEAYRIAVLLAQLMEWRVGPPSVKGLLKCHLPEIANHVVN